MTRTSLFVAGNGDEAHNVAEAIVHDALSQRNRFFDGTIEDLAELLDEA